MIVDVASLYISDDMIFSGTDADANNRHPIILRKSMEENKQNQAVRTKAKDSMFLNGGSG